MWKLYYFAGDERIAMRVKSDAGPDEVFYLFSDHLGSTSEVRKSDGTLHSQQMYKAFGEARYQSGSLPTQHKYTGQLEIEFGLVHFGPRIYDSLLGRWVQPDNVIPTASQGVLAWDRYAFVNNNPVLFNDPSGHDVGCPAANPSCMGLSGYSNGERYIAYKEIAANLSKLIQENSPAPSIHVETSIDAGQTPADRPKVWEAPIIHAQHGYLRAGPQQSVKLEFDISTKALLGDGLSHSTSVVPALLKGGNGAAPSPVLTPLGGIFSGYAQWQRDQELPLTPEKRWARAGIATVESMFVSSAASIAGIPSGAAAAAIFSETGPGAVVAFGAGWFVGYSSSYSTLSNYVNQINTDIYYQLDLNP